MVAAPESFWSVKVKELVVAAVVVAAVEAAE
jgi:hypothetical protein